MKHSLLSLLALLSVTLLTAQSIRTIQSPDGATDLVVSFSEKLTYKINYNNKEIVSASEVDMVLHDGRSLAKSGGVKKATARAVNDVIISPVPEKRKRIPDHYNEVRFDLKSTFFVIFRVYNDGVAYRIGTSVRDSIKVVNELATFNFPQNHKFLHSKVQGGRKDKFHTSFEENYELLTLDSITKQHLVFNPAVVCPDTGPKIALTESDVENYPGMFLTGSGSTQLTAVFAPYPKTLKPEMAEFSQFVVTERENFISKTSGSRTYPWRILMIATHDKDLPANDMVYRLASPSRVADVSWVTPMQSTDEWIITENIFNVDFKSGINTDTYKYYIDFAKKVGIESVMMDAGWSDNNDLFKITPTLNIDEIMSYAKKQGVKINMWTLAMTLDRQLEPALKQFKKWDVSFIMTDFIDRDDQVANEMYKRIAEACARHKIMIMFHGAPKPSGFNRTYPHAITREGVLGSEFNMWSHRVTPEHNATLPFTRMLAGPMDYEPGLLSNGTKKTFRPIEEMVMSYGTRTNQLAMYVVYESPIQFFSGNPSQGLLEPQFMELLGSIPTVWDTTIVIDAKITDYIVTARKSGNDWFVGAMTDSSSRDISVPLSFLDEGTYQATICLDGVNADRYAADYKLMEKTVTAQDLFTFKMHPGGGMVARIRKK